MSTSTDSSVYCLFSGLSRPIVGLCGSFPPSPWVARSVDGVGKGRTQEVEGSPGKNSLRRLWDGTGSVFWSHTKE